MGYMCMLCGKTTQDPKGSGKAPFCKECFSKKFDDDYNAYFRWMETRMF